MNSEAYILSKQVNNIFFMMQLRTNIVLLSIILEEYNGFVVCMCQYHPNMNYHLRMGVSMEMLILESKHNNADLHENSQKKNLKQLTSMDHSVKRNI